MLLFHAPEEVPTIDKQFKVSVLPDAMVYDEESLIDFGHFLAERYGARRQMFTSPELNTGNRHAELVQKIYAYCRADVYKILAQEFTSAFRSGDYILQQQSRIAELTSDNLYDVQLQNSRNDKDVKRFMNRCEYNGIKGIGHVLRRKCPAELEELIFRTRQFGRQCGMTE
jgi:hypothetical protein